MIGFVSAGISASFAGTFADRYGRKTACLAFCVIYSLSCTTLFTDNINVLFLGRVLGGVSGTLLWSVFESWLVAEFNQLQLQDADPILSGIFSTMTTANTCVAIAAGILAEWLVRSAGTAKAPFLASIGCLSLAFVAISRAWVCAIVVILQEGHSSALGRKLWFEQSQRIGRRHTTSAGRSGDRTCGGLAVEDDLSW